MPQSLKHTSWETRGLHSCESFHTWRNLGTPGDLLSCRKPHLYPTLIGLLPWSRLLMPSLASISLDERSCQSQSCPAVLGQQNLNRQNLFQLLIYLGPNLWHQVNHFISLFIRLLSLTLRSPVGIIRGTYRRDYPKHFEHIQDIITWNSFLWLHS